ncbi:MAG: hypothetical protein J1F35_04480 [Erysipelotrichales bacterium]|nr:hypothetical protein [Erysipelotrichales bacterium]
MNSHLLFLVLGIIFLILLGISIYVILVFNKLKTYKNEVDRLWNLLRIKIENQFKYINSNFESIMLDNKEYLKEIIDKYMLLAYIEDIMTTYVELEKIIDNVEENPVKTNFLKENEEIDKLKVDYNNVLLKYNNTINIMTNKFIADAFKFKQGIYFISKK